MGRPRLILCGLTSALQNLLRAADGGPGVVRLGTVDVLLADEDLLPSRADVVATEEGWLLRDLGEPPGAVVNGQPLDGRTRPLRPADVVQCGGLSLTVNGPPDPEPPPPAPPGSPLEVRAVAHRSWKEALEALARYDGGRADRAGHLLTLFRAGYHLRHAGSLRQLLRSSLADAVAVLGAQQGCVVLADEATGRLRDDPFCVAPEGGGPPGPHSRRMAQWAFERSESLLCRDAHAAAGPEADSLRLKNLSSVICAVLRSPRKKLGVLHLGRGPLREPFTQEEFFLADALAASLSAGVESAQLVAGQRELFLQTVTALARAVDLRDRYTGNHAQRVTDYALLLAEELKLTEAERQQLRVGSPLHDVGKIGVSDQILQKPGRLSPAEREVMKAHTVTGAAMLEGIPGLRPVLPIVRSHHERWDGTGYPDGLAGEAIPPTARVVAVADAFDAMTSDRPYRRALPAAEAFGEVAAGAGSHFAPECAAAMLRLRPRIEGLAGGGATPRRAPPGNSTGGGLTCELE
jgi:putative nucleotidyltransferase with HDIG domain